MPNKDQLLADLPHPSSRPIKSYGATSVGKPAFKSNSYYETSSSFFGDIKRLTKSWMGIDVSEDEKCRPIILNSPRK